MTRSREREKAMITVYQWLLVKRDINELIETEFGMPVDQVDPYFVRVIYKATENEERYHQYIDKVLKGWTYDRLGTLEKAILLNGCAEFDLKETEAPVIINESVDLAKKYGDEDSYKLINSVLDII